MSNLLKYAKIQFYRFIFLGIRGIEFAMLFNMPCPVLAKTSKLGTLYISQKKEKEEQLSR